MSAGINLSKPADMAVGAPADGGFTAKLRVRSLAAFATYKESCPVSPSAAIYSANMDDSELIRAYADTGSEAAFTTLVQRHVGLSIRPHCVNLRESAQDDAIVVNVESLLHRGDGLDDIHFSRPMPARSIDATEAIELDLSVVGDGRIARTPAVEVAVNQLGFGGVVLAPAQPDVEAGRLAGIIVFRQRDSVGKNRAVNFRGGGMDLPLALIPLRLIGLKLLAALNTLIGELQACSMAAGVANMSGYSRSIWPACA